MNPDQNQVDVLVIGAGSAGVSAAVGAARCGASVALVEKNDYPGGKATAAMVGTVCGLYKTGTSDTPQWAVGGFAREFAEELAESSGSLPEHFFQQLFFLPYRIEAFKAVCLRSLSEAGVTCHWGATVENVDVEGDTISGLTIQKDGQHFLMSPRSVIDCTGEAVLSRLVSADWVHGGENQAAARVFGLSGIGEIPAEAIHFALTLVIQKGVKSGELSPTYTALSVVPGSYRGDRAYFKLPLPEDVTNDSAQREEMLARSTNSVSEIVHYLNHQSGVFSGVKLAELAPEAGFRTGFRPIGRSTLQESDVLNPRAHPEGIANGAWPIEYWRPGESAEMAYFKEGQVYQIPAGCLESVNAKNLYFGGRNLSATSRAQASARVMGTCLQTGYAAGILAATKAQGGDRHVAIERVRTDLDIK